MQATLLPVVGTPAGETAAELVWAPLPEAQDASAAGAAAASPFATGADARAFLRYWSSRELQEAALGALWKAKHNVAAADAAMHKEHKDTGRTLAQARAITAHRCPLPVHRAARRA